MSDAERWRQVRSIFEEAVELPVEERADFLGRECGEDSGLRDEVERLLRADEASGPGLTGAVASALRDTAATLRVGDEVGPYRVVGELGRGGMGVVLAGERIDGAYRKQVAIKVLPSGLHSKAAQRRFEDERQFLADLEHPSIAQLLDGGTTPNGLSYLVMEKVDGTPIDEYCSENKLGVGGRLELMVQVCGAVSHAHSRFVVHRDLKPSNILVTREGIPKLLDFGIAKLLDSGGDAPVDQTVDWFLTPEFASPEQIEGKPITAATDVYGLGALLYFLLTGQSPLASVARTPAELMKAISEVQPEPVSQVSARGGLGHPPAGHRGKELDAIIACALRKDPGRRYSSAEQLAADLGRFLDDRPVRALPDSFSYRLGKFLRRQWIPVVAATLVAASLVAGFVARDMESKRAQREAETATKVAEFLESLFAAATPEETLGKEVTAEDLLDRGAERIQRELQDQPRLQARLLHTIAFSYEGLGNYDAAESLYKRALELQEARLGERHLETAETLLALGRVYGHVGQFARGEVFIKRSATIYEDLLDDDHIALIGAYTELSAILSAQAHSTAKVQEAERLLLKVGESFDRHRKSYPRRYLIHLRDLAGFYWETGQLALALPTLEEAAAESEEFLGPQDPFTLGTLSFLSSSLHEKGELERADEILASLCSRIEEVLGPNHDEMSGCLRSQGATWVELGRLSEAERVLDRAIELEKVIYGEEHHYTAAIQIYRVRLLLEQGDIATAGALLAPTLEALERGYGFEHHVFADALDIAARVHFAQGQVQEAERMIRQALPIRLRAYGAGSTRVEESKALLARMTESKVSS